MGDELRGDCLVHLNVRFSDEADLKQLLDFLYDKSKQGVKFTGLMEIVSNEVTIATAIHNIKSNKGNKTSGVDKIKMDRYLQMPKNEVIYLIQQTLKAYRPRPAKRVYIDKSNGKKRPLINFNIKSATFYQINIHNICLYLWRTYNVECHFPSSP